MTMSKLMMMMMLLQTLSMPLLGSMSMSGTKVKLVWQPDLATFLSRFCGYAKLSRQDSISGGRNWKKIRPDCE